jgi:hypothetical protein
LNCELAVVPWYVSDANYREFKDSAVDQADFFDGFDEWLEVAMEHEHLAEAQGVIICRIRMSYEAFCAWCLTSGYRNDAAGRTAFAEVRASQILDW